MALNRINRALLLFAFIYVFIIAFVSFSYLSRVFPSTPSNLTGEVYFSLPFNLTTNYWALVDQNTSFFSAYFEDRTESSPSLVLMGAHRGSHQPLYCQSSYNDSVQACVRITLNSFVGSPHISHTFFNPFRYTCRLQRTDAPLFVRVFHSPDCITSRGNNTPIPVVAERPKNRKQFGLCVGSAVFRGKGFEEVVGAIESNRLLGSEWFTVYIQDVGRNTIPALKVYQELGLGEVIDTWADEIAPSPWFYNGQILLINDCLYRNMFRVQYLVFADLDELIVPAKSLSWSDMMKTIDHSSFGAFMFRHLTYVPPKKFNIETLVNGSFSKCNDGHKLLVPRSLEYYRKGAVILRYFRRTKLIVKPRLLSSIGIHHVSKFYHRTVQLCRVPAEVGLLHHYRRRRAYNEDAPHTPDHAFDAVAEKLMRSIHEMICEKMHKFL